MVSDLIDNYADSFAVVEYHQSDSFSFPWGESRANFYSVWSSGIPWFAYDGLFDAWPISTYESKLQQRINVQTPVTLSVGGDHFGGNTYQLQVRACLEEDANSVSLRIYAVGVEDDWPASPSYSRNTFRVAGQTTDIALQPGECETVEPLILLAGYSNIENAKIIAWAQTPNSIAPALVYQAAKQFWPLEALPEHGDSNNDGSVDLDDFFDFGGCLTGPDPSVTPTAGCLSVFDVDSDEDVDVGDFAEFQRVFGYASE